MCAGVELSITFVCLYLMHEYCLATHKPNFLILNKDNKNLVFCVFTVLIVFVH